MKFKNVSKLATVAVVLSFSVVGCKHGLDKTTPLPGRGVASVGDLKPTGPISPENNLPVIQPVKQPTVEPLADPSRNIPLNGNLTMWGPAADQPFKSETVYFEYDKAIVKADEVSKVERVANGIKGLAGKALRIEGHCDERGTEEYNRSPCRSRS